MENTDSILNELNKLPKEDLINVIDEFKNYLTNYSLLYTTTNVAITINAVLQVFGTFIKVKAHKNKEYTDWLLLRKNSIDEFGEKLCYCGHSYKCTCGDPDKATFEQSVLNKTIKLGDPENGWKTFDNFGINNKYKYQCEYERFIKRITDKFISLQSNVDCEWCDIALCQKEALEYLKDNMISYNDWVAKYKN